MTRAQAEEKLKAMGIPEPTQEQITALLDTIKAESSSNTEKNAADKKELDRLKGVEKELEDLKGQSLTSEEKIKKAQEDMKNKEKEYATRISRLSVENILKAADLAEEDYKDLLDSIISDDEEASKIKANTLVSVLNAKLEKQKSKIEKEFDQKIKDGTPNPSGSDGGGKALTAAEEIAKKIGSQSNGDQGTTILEHYTGGIK